MSQVDHSRRRLLTAATVGSRGGRRRVSPRCRSWHRGSRAQRAKALGAPVEVDASKLEEGQMLKVVWRGQPVFIVRRGKTIVASLGSTTMRCWPTRIRKTRCSRPTSRCRRRPRAQSRVLGGPRGLYPSRLLAAGRVRTEQRLSGDGHRLGPELARRILLPLPRLEIRHLRPSVQEHAGAEEPDGAAVHVHAATRAS